MVAIENERGHRYGYMFMPQIVNDCFKQHFKQMEEVQKVRGKMTTNTSGFGMQGNTAGLQILPFEMPELFAALGGVAVVAAIILAL